MNKTATKSRYHREFILCGIFGLIIAVVFGSTIYADFVQWDDDINIYRNPSVQGLTTANLQWMLTDTDYVRRYMPLGWLSWAIDFELYGLNPAGYHLGNLILHALNSILVFLVLRRLFIAGRSATNVTSAVGAAQAYWPAVVGALFWAIHPLRVEPVAWASGRLYCQATCLLLLCLFAYLKAVEHSTTRRRWYFLSLMAYACSLLTYPIGLGLIPVLVIVDQYPLRRFNSGWRGWIDAHGRRRWAEKIPFVAVAAAMFALTLWCRVNSTGIWRPPVTLEVFGIYSRIMQGFYVWGCYLWKTWAPVDLAPFYVTLVKFDPNGFIFLANAALVVGLSIYLVWQRRRWPGALALWACYLILLVPMLGFTEHPHYPSDRYSYIPGIVYAAAIALLLRRWISGSAFQQKIRLGCAALVLALFGYLSFAQCKIWESSNTMFLHVVGTLGNDQRRGDFYHRLGTYRLSVGDYGGAEEALRQARIVQPKNLVTRVQFGHALAFQDKMAEAAIIYESVLREAPDHRETRINLAHALTEIGKRAEAETHHSQLLARWPDDAQVHMAYAQFLAGDGRFDEAITHYLETKRLMPREDRVYTELGRILIQQGKTQQAIQTLQEALKRLPNATGPLIALAWIYATNEEAGFRNASEAIALAGRANKLTGGEYSAALDTLAAAYAEAERYGEAVKAAESALRAAAGSPREEGIRDRLKLYVQGRPYREAAVAR